MVPYKFLDIKNHGEITKQLENLFLGDLYLHIAENGDNFFLFQSWYDNQPKYDITKHRLLWNFATQHEVFDRCPDLKKAIDDLGIVVTGCSVLVITYDGSGGRLGLHSDASSGEVQYRLNWPVYQCFSGTKTSMYKLKTGTINRLLVDPTVYTPPSQDLVAKSETGIYEMSDVESEIASFVMDRPLLFRYTIPHRVYDTEPNIPYPRILICFDLENNGSDLLESLKTI